MKHKHAWVLDTRASEVEHSASRRSGRYTFDRFRPIKVSASRGFDDKRVSRDFESEILKGNRALFESWL